MKDLQLAHSVDGRTVLEHPPEVDLPEHLVLVDGYGLVDDLQVVLLDEHGLVEVLVEQWEQEVLVQVVDGHVLLEAVAGYLVEQVVRTGRVGVSVRVCVLVIVCVFGGQVLHTVLVVS